MKESKIQVSSSNITGVLLVGRMTQEVIEQAKKLTDNICYVDFTDHSEPYDSVDIVAPYQPRSPTSSLTKVINALVFIGEQDDINTSDIREVAFCWNTAALKT